MSASMMAARLGEGAEQFELVEVPVPEIGAGECLVRVHSTGICGSDLHVIEGMTPTPFRPITLGHESAGTVVAIGAGVDAPAEGDRVVINPLLTCGKCRPCRIGRPQICDLRQVLGIHTNGAFAQYVRVPADNLSLVPDELSLLEAAVIEPIATPYHALTSRAPVRPGSRVAIIGVGGLGIHGVQVARMLGATTIIAIDTDEVALRRAGDLGATDLVHAGEADAVAAVAEISGEGVDVSLECVGLPVTVQQSTEVLAPGGIAAVIGLGAEPAPLWSIAELVRKERELRGVYGYSKLEMQEVARLLVAGRLEAKVAISATYPLEEINAGLEHFRTRKESPVRILIRAEEGSR